MELVVSFNGEHLDIGYAKAFCCVWSSQGGSEKAEHGENKKFWGTARHTDALQTGIHKLINMTGEFES